MLRLLLLCAAALALGPAAVARAGSGDKTFGAPAWSPDGSRIAWVAADEIWTAAADGSGAHLRAKHSDGAVQLQWVRPHEFLFDSNFQLFRLGPGRTAVTIMDAGFSFTMDAAAARVAWGSVGCSTCHGPVVVLTLATRAVVSIGGKNVANSNPTLSPDGARVAFERRLYDKKAGQYGIFDGLWVAGTNGASLARISADGYCASWSPDGRTLAYLGWKDHALRTMRPDGGAVRLLLRAGPSCSVPASWEWSPDSKKIAYIAPGAGRLVVMNVATRATRTVSASGLANVTGFAWSPDSMQLLVTGRPDAFACSSLWLVGTRAASPKLLRAC